MDKAYCGVARCGNARCDVYVPIWDNEILPKLKSVDASKLWTEILTELKKAS